MTLLLDMPAPDLWIVVNTFLLMITNIVIFNYVNIL